MILWKLHGTELPWQKQWQRFLCGVQSKTFFSSSSSSSIQLIYTMTILIQKVY